MEQSSLWLPVCALAVWTLLVLMVIPYRRFKASFAGEIGPGDFRYGESERVSPWVSIANRAYMNLLEAPLLFYVLCISLEVSGRTAPPFLGLAWGYVVLRVLHSLVHLSYNNVMHRLALFAASNVVLALGWFLFGFQIMGLA